MKQKYSVLIIGAGQIGSFYDSPKSKDILTHAHAFSSHPGFNLLGFVDKNQNQAKKAAKIWRTETFPDIKSVYKNNKVDVVVEAVSDEYHFKVLKKISEFPVKLVLAEKPLTINVDDGKKIIELYNKKKIPVLVNYSRRFVPEFQDLQKNIKKGLFGAYLSGSGYYGKGFLHNGSHMIDLLRYLIGEIKDSKRISEETDFSKNDKSMSVVLHFNNDRYFSLQNINCQKYSIFELDLFFEKARIRIINSGFQIEEYVVNEDEKFKGYRQLTKKKNIETQLNKACYYCADNIYNFLRDTEEIHSTMEEGLKTLIACKKIANE